MLIRLAMHLAFQHIPLARAGTLKTTSHGHGICFGRLAERIGPGPDQWHLHLRLAVFTGI